MITSPNHWLGSDNMVLFYAEYEGCGGESIGTPKVKEFLDSLQVKPGLSKRKPAPHDVGALMEARDNRIGQIYLAAKHKMMMYIFDINNYGHDNWYCYNDKFPGQFKIEALMPPMDIGFYKVCAGEKTLSRIIFEFILYIHFLFSAFGKGAGGKILTWMMFKSLDELGHNPPHYLLMRWFWKKKTGPMSVYFQEYHLQNPIRELSKELVY